MTSRTGSASAPPVRVTHVLWRLSRGGGVQTVVRMLITATDRREVAFTLVTARPRLAEDELEALGVDVVPLDHRGATLRRLDRLRLVVAAVRAVRRTRPDAVHLHSGTIWMGFLVPLFVRGRRLVVEVHDAPGSGRHSPWTDRVEGWWTRGTRATVVCHSTSVARGVSERWRVPAERVDVVPLAVDLDRWTLDPAQRPARRASLGLAPEDVAVVVVGRMVPSKRFELAVEALAACRSDRLVLVLVGDGPERSRVLERASQLGVASRVKAVGFAPVITDVVGACDVLLSTSDYEGFGLVIVEGMAASLPVVATAVGGVTDIVVDGVTGLLAGAGDRQAITDALDALAGDDERRRELGRAGRRRVEASYSSIQLARAFTDIYRRAGGRA